MLTLEQIVSEPAGSRLDAWVAEYVMGWSYYRKNNSAGVDQWRVTGPNGEDGYGPVATFDRHTGERTDHEWYAYADLPHYSGDISAAMGVLCKARDGGQFVIQDWYGGKYHCLISGKGAGIGDTISEAICRAALRAALGRARGRRAAGA